MPYLAIAGKRLNPEALEAINVMLRASSLSELLLYLEIQGVPHLHDTLKAPVGEEVRCLIRLDISSLPQLESVLAASFRSAERVLEGIAHLEKMPTPFA